MVIIQQQRTEGHKFISTVVETPNSFSSSFSLNSHLSISERSAIYKQRIDSLFGPNKFRQERRVDSYQIRIDGKRNSPSAGLTASNSNITASIVPTFGTNREGQIISISSEDEYSRIETSNITDSLNPVKTNRNITSVQITSDESERSALQSLMHTTSSSGEEALGRIDTDKIMWRNSAYGESSSSPANSSSSKPFSTVKCSPGGVLKFGVEYLGSVPVTGSTATLTDLQAPLRTLYVNYLENKNMMTGQLAITSDGLRFEAPKIRLVNPFSTIAVWAAVKLVGRGEPLPTECAFMPLISDPEGQDKSRLFSKMDPELCTVYQACITNPSKSFKNPPMFACVMREATFALDCHAFVCKCAEDAIVIAANLYQSLVDKMRTGKEGESGYGSLTRISPTTQSSMNQNRSSSSSSSMAGPPLPKFTCSIKPLLTKRESSSSTQNESRAVFSDSESIVPVRPPRKKKKPSDIPSSNLKRYNSDDSVLLNLPYRRRSFRGGYQGQYIKNKKRVQIHTPEDDVTSLDSFTDSVDQILDEIVDPCGMSFKDLKPSYQDLILKIALTLTQDQLYKKSKQAMKKQQKSRKKIKSASSSAEGSDDNSQFMNNFLKSISKINLGGKSIPISKRTPSKSGASGLISRQKQKILAKPQITVPTKAILKKPKDHHAHCHDDIPFMSFCSGCACEKCSEKCYCSLNKQLNEATTPSSSAASTPSHPICSSTEIHRKSCGYDTDSCAESEKCYCSLQRVKSNGLKIYNINLDTETSDTDTNSYDLQNFHSPINDTMVLNRTTTSSHSSRAVEILSYHPSRRLSYCFSPTSSFIKGPQGGLPIYSARDKSPHKLPKDVTIPDGKTSKNKVLLITGSNASGQVIYKDCPYQKSEFGCMPRHFDATYNLSSSSPEGREKSDTPCSSSSEKNKAGFQPERFQSMKKSAEIAAMFTEMKLNPTADFILGNTSETDDMAQSQTQESTSIDFQTSLGYLP